MKEPQCLYLYSFIGLLCALTEDQSADFVSAIYLLKTITYFQWLLLFDVFTSEQHGRTWCTFVEHICPKSVQSKKRPPPDSANLDWHMHCYSFHSVSLAVGSERSA